MKGAWERTQTDVGESLARLDGVRGYGEAPSSPYYGATAAAARDALERARPQIETAMLDDPAELWEQLCPLLGGSPFAQCALDVAAHDLWGKLRGEPVWKLAPTCKRRRQPFRGTS